jgi:hypothetical protein
VVAGWADEELGSISVDEVVAEIIPSDFNVLALVNQAGVR